MNRTPPSDESSLPVIIIGAGGHCTVLLDLLGRLGRRVLFITDRDPVLHGQHIGGIEIHGSDEAIFEHLPEQVRLVNAVGSIAPAVARRQVYRRFVERGYEFETLIHPSAVVSRAALIEPGVQVMAGAVVQPGARIGANALINTRASIDHDCIVGPHVHVAPGVTLSGRVEIGEASHIGTAAAVIQGICIGREAMVAAGAVVVRNVSDRETVMGVPARAVQAAKRADGQLGGGIREGERFTVMLSAAGRRVALLKLIRGEIEELGLLPRIVATDITPSSAAFHAGDVSRLVPRYSDPTCLERLLKLCEELRIRLIVPTIDPDLPFYAKHREAFEAVGTQIMISSPEMVQICNDKTSTHEWLVEQGFPTVRQIEADRLLQPHHNWSFPVFVKPRGGSSSIGARVVQDQEELHRAIQSGDFIAQEVAPGREYTVDVYVDRQGRCRCTVPRLRIETRGGEVVKGMTVRCGPIEQVCCRVAESLPGGSGVMNIQVFHDARSGQLNVSEINPRFGGGYPLTHQAGAPMTRWLIEEMTGRRLTANNDQWIDGLVMLRYDEAVFVRSQEAGAGSLLSGQNSAVPVLAGD
jgi:carbamoyl-phosphate synthase large subunit